jgi:ATP-binding cassette, subfamily B (MDR/TAP), member 1
MYAYRCTSQSIIFANLINALSLTPASYLRQRVDFWSLMYLAMGLALFAVYLGQGMGFAYTSEKLTHRARERTFRHILRQDVAFFDVKENSIGTLTSLLSSAPSDLNGMSGAVMGALLTFLSTIIGGIVLSLIIGWKLALVCTATIPLVAGFGWVRLTMLTLIRDKMKKTHQDSAAYASEAISAIRTVASLNMEARVLEHYNEILDRQSKKAIQSILQASALYAASQSVTFLCAALAFWYGGTLISTYEYTILQFFICFASLISGAQIAGAIFSYSPGMSKAIDAARDLKSLFDRLPPIDSWDNTGARAPTREAFKGAVEFRNVSFSYASRSDRLVVDNFSMSIRPGQNIALVGPSGCGKSTLIALLERFFDPTSGHIFIDGQDISKLDVNSYRSLISLVGQEPTLYSGTIRENLVLGSPESVSEQEITQACKDANIYDVIMSLP